MIPDRKLTIDVSDDSPSYDGKCCYIHAVSRKHSFRIAEVALQQSETASTKVKLDFVPTNGDKVFFVVEYWEDITTDDETEIRVTHGYRHEWDASNHTVHVSRRDRMYVDVSQDVWMGVVGVVVPGWV